MAQWVAVDWRARPRRKAVLAFSRVKKNVKATFRCF